MKSAIERRIHSYEINKELNERKDVVAKEEVILRKIAAKDKQITSAREFYAASKISALVRGFIDRILCRRKRKMLRAIRTIQRLMLGKLGRMRWKREYWKSVSVVKSETALQELVERSQALREKSKPGRHGYHWTEYFDPLTDSFWYFNKQTKQNTWHVPLIFQKDLICSWEGFHDFGGMEYQKPCRCVFNNMEEYRGHMRNAHKWYCVACCEKNNGMSFPICQLCGNKYNGEGMEGEKAIRTQLEKVQKKLEHFLKNDMKPEDEPTYSIKKRMVEIAADRQRMRDELFAFNAINADKTVDPVSHKSIKDKKEELEEDYQRMLMLRGKNKAASNAAYAIQAMADNHFDYKGDGSTSEQMKLLKALTTPMPTAINSNAKIPPISSSGTPKSGSKRPATTSKILTPDDPAFLDLSDYRKSIPPDDVLPEIRSVVAASAALEEKLTGGLAGEIERFRDPLSRGILNEDDWETFTSLHDDDMYTKLRLGIFDEEDEDDDTSTQLSMAGYEDMIHSLAGDAEAEEAARLAALKAEEARTKLEVCVPFLTGQCTRTTCPLAHPGVRDNAVPKYKTSRNDNGDKIRTPFVTLCLKANGIANGCPNGKLCKKYHVYIRPSTEEIIRTMYPIAEGIRTHHFAGGAVLTGNVKRDEFNGYAVMTWRDGSTYMGDWKDGLRHGFGIHRSTDAANGCMEYIGCYKEGKRHGWGMLSNSNGDEYLGEWHTGKMSGVGCFTSKNGDFYQGGMYNNLYSGVGVFKKANGNIYVGHFKEGKAWGLGILTMISGERYKGYFDRNSRCGKGICEYPNGSKYAGNWYRGVHDGKGTYISPKGERYVGNWSGGKKHGVGRYIFENKDYFDGEFVKDKAHGMGVYVHNNGNIYTGQWVNDKRQGKGTYLFANGSKYTGHWHNNNMHHKGKFDFANGSFYRGMFDVNTKHGKGIYTWPNGNEYKGEFHHDKLCGTGEMKYHNHHRYVGLWADNKKNGYGVMYYASGPIYEGEWRDDIRQGQGRITFSPGATTQEVYDGQWDNDQWNGYGTYWYRADEGTVYEGDWVNGVRHGVGKLTYKDGSYYRGDFHQEQMWGKGVYVGADGTQYDGEWRANMRQGIGTSLLPDGSIHTGEYWGNMRHGAGKCIRPDGSIYHGNWEGNIIVGPGKVTFTVGQKSKKDGLCKELTVKVFGY